MEGNENKLAGYGVLDNRMYLTTVDTDTTTERSWIFDLDDDGHSQ